VLGCKGGGYLEIDPGRRRFLATRNLLRLRPYPTNLIYLTCISTSLFPSNHLDHKHMDRSLSPIISGYIQGFEADCRT
jgi:hypothetical protein